MDPSELRALRRLAREMEISLAAVDAAQDCGLFDEAATADESRRTLRRMRRLMHDLGVNATGAALLVRMRRELLLMHLELNRLHGQRDRWLDNWHEGLWRDLSE